MKKIVFLVLSIILITGCSVQYNLEINNDLSIVEEAKLTGTDSFFSNYYKTTKKNVIKSQLELYHKFLDEKGYTYELVESSIPYVNVSKKYDNIDSFTKNSILFNDYFDEVKYTKDGNINKIETIGFNPNNSDNPERFDVKELEITITCPYKVTSHNAKSVSEKTNTYHYELNENNNKILLEFDSSKKFNPYERTIWLIFVFIAIIIISWVMVYILNKKKK